MGCPDLAPVNEAIGAAEWILHAATQDLACLAEVGLRPKALFDTELAARLLGLPRVGLAAVVEHYLGLALAKEHSAADWSRRPLPEPWLRYAALDVEVLVDLRNLMGVDLAAQGKAEWARQEFEALLAWAPTTRIDPWRRTAGLHRFRAPRDLAVVRELWWERERIARDRDVSPTRVVPDAALLAVAEARPRDLEELPQTLKALARNGRQWVAAVDRAMSLPPDQLPPSSRPHDGPPPARAWREKNPEAADRLLAVRALIGEFAAAHPVPIENVCSPDPLRRVVWQPPADTSVESFTEALLALGVRRWQAVIVAPALHKAFVTPPA